MPLAKEPPDVLGATERALVEKELSAILDSPSFHASRRCQDFLRFVVHETVEGRADGIKERSIAMSVFERRSDYEPAADSIVRVKAIEVRKKLTEFYEKHPERLFRIELQPGTYVPAFRYEIAPHGSRWRWSRIGIPAGCAVVLIGAAAWLFRPPATYVDQIWAPMLGRDHVVLVALPSPNVLQIDTSGVQRMMEQYYVGVGAAYGATMFTGLLGARHQSYQVKIGQQVSFADLRRQPTVLLGAYSSPLTIDMTSQLRFRFRAQDRAAGTSSIYDSTDSRREWKESFERAPARDMSEAYSMVLRVRDSGSGQILMIAAGLNAYGTHSAAEFLSNESLLAEFARRAGRDWLRKNFQVVLHSQVYQAVPGPPEIVAWHVW